MSSRTIFRDVIFFECCAAPAHSRGDRPTHLLNEPGGFWDSRHQNACMGGWIPRKNKAYEKVRIKKTNMVVYVESVYLCAKLETILSNQLR